MIPSFIRRLGHLYPSKPPRRWTIRLVTALLSCLGLVFVTYRKLLPIRWPESDPIAAKCNYDPWSVPAVFPSQARQFVLRAPTALAVGHDLTVVGTMMPALRPVYWSQAVPRTPFAAARNGHDIGRPAGGVWFLGPKALADQAGRIHVIWAEPSPSIGDTISMRQYEKLSAQRVMYAVYDPKTGWSPTTIIFQTSTGTAESIGQNLEWSRTADATLDGSGDVHVVVSERRTRRILYLSGHGNSWFHTYIANLHSNYLGIAADPRNRIYVVYLSQRTPRAGPAHDVLLVTSGNSGRTWSTPSGISELGDLLAFEPRIAVDHTGSLHVVWRQITDVSSHRMSLRHVSSTTQGRRWTSAQDLSIPWSDFDLAVRMGIDPCGSVHIAYGSESGITYTRWNGSWLHVQTLFPGYLSREVSITSTPDGIVQLYWESYRGRGTDNRHVQFVPMSSHIRPAHATPTR
jgi:hypothetical protein